MAKPDKIKVTTESDQAIEVHVSSYKENEICVLLGEEPHGIRCKLEPTRNGLAYAGSVRGREIIYRRSVEQVREEIQNSKTDLEKRWKR